MKNKQSQQWPYWFFVCLLWIFALCYIVKLVIRLHHTALKLAVLLNHQCNLLLFQHLMSKSPCQPPFIRSVKIWKVLTSKCTTFHGLQNTFFQTHASLFYCILQFHQIIIVLKIIYTLILSVNFDHVLFNFHIYYILN